MKTYQIREHGCKFAEVDAESAVAALETAEREYPRRACDYNQEPGDESFIVQWWAVCSSNTSDSAMRGVEVPAGV